MQDWLAEYTIKIEAEQNIQTDPTETALNFEREQLAELHSQQEKICEYLEKEIYTVEMFTKRNVVLTKEIKNNKQQKQKLYQQHSIFLIAIPDYQL